MSQGLGWPFLVAPGRRRDYSTLMAPDFLVADADYGVLDEAVRPTDSPRAVEVRTRAGRRLTIVHATHLLIADDLGPGCAPPRDEHNRPLRLIYGYVVPGEWAAQPAEADLRAALGTALDVYRRFLDDEETVVVAAAQPFRLHSPGPARPPARVPLPGPPAGRRQVSGTAWIVAAVLVGLLAGGAVAANLLSRPDGPPIKLCPTATATTAGGLVPVAVSTRPSPTCNPPK
jgi:hypothetical protein